MNEEIKAKWLDALRSGKYQQTTNVLRRERHGAASYCCLGVLCEVVDPDGVWMESGSGQGANNRTFGFGTPQADGFPPKRVSVAAGLSAGEMQHLSAMNDGATTAPEEGATFLEIADWIATHL